MVVKGFLVSIWSHGTNTGGRISSSGGVWDSGETATGVITFSLFCECVSSDNMGNKEFSMGVFSFKEGINFTKFPTMEELREAFLLYHMNMIPKTIKHKLIATNEAKMSLGTMKMDTFHLCSQGPYLICPWTWSVILIL